MAGVPGGYVPTMNEGTPTTPTSLADVVALLRRQHEAISSSLADVLNEAESGREASFARVKRLLSVHEALEQVVVHPPLAQAAGVAGRSRLDEEVELSKAITYLEAIGPRSDGFEGPSAVCSTRCARTFPARSRTSSRYSLLTSPANRARRSASR